MNVHSGELWVWVLSADRRGEHKVDRIIVTAMSRTSGSAIKEVNKI